MRTLTRAVLALIFFACASCGNRDESSEQSPDSQPTVSVPEVNLHTAVVTDDLEAIRQHIAAGSDVNMLEPSRASTPLISAAAFGKVEAARILIEGGADLNFKNVDGSTALHTAAVFGETEIAELLISAGTDLNIQNNERATALHAAAFFGRVEIVRALLAKNADKTLLNGTGRTALETVERPFEDDTAVYDAIGTALQPLGLTLDYDQIKTARPEIAEMLK